MLKLSTAAGSEGLENAYKWAIQNSSSNKTTEVKNLEMTRGFGREYNADAQ